MIGFMLKRFFRIIDFKFKKEHSNSCNIWKISLFHFFGDHCSTGHMYVM